MKTANTNNIKVIDEKLKQIYEMQLNSHWDEKNKYNIIKILYFEHEYDRRQLISKSKKIKKLDYFYDYFCSGEIDQNSPIPITIEENIMIFMDNFYSIFLQLLDKFKTENIYLKQIKTNNNKLMSYEFVISGDEKLILNFLENVEIGKAYSYSENAKFFDDKYCNISSRILLESGRDIEFIISIAKEYILDNKQTFTFEDFRISNSHEERDYDEIMFDHILINLLDKLFIDVCFSNRGVQLRI